MLLVATAVALACLLAGGVAYARQCARQIPSVQARPPSLLIVMDASKSMSKPAGAGQTRLQAAKAALRTLVRGLPDGTRVGLRLYGHRVSGATRAEGCRDTELVVPVGPLDRGRLVARIDSYEAVGFTPIGRALRAAADDLPSDGPASIVLVSDGGDNCAPPSPCSVAEQIARRGPDLSVQAVGFQVTDRARAQLRCIAERGRGVYRDAANADELAVALRALAARATRTFEPNGRRVSGGRTARAARPIGSGRFRDLIASGGERWYRVSLMPSQRLAAGAVLIVACPLQAGVADVIGTTLKLSVIGDAGINVPDAYSATANLFAGDASVEAVGLMTAPVRAAAGAAQSPGRPGSRLLRVELGDNGSGGLAAALDGAPIALQLDVNRVGGTPAVAAARADAHADETTSAVVLIGVVVGALALGALGGVAAGVRRARGRA
jgi:Ca-activated chloride channel family protein